MSNEKIVQQELENNPKLKELVIRTGAADTIEKPEPLTISGTIDSPSRYIDYRKENIEVKTSHALVSKSEGTIQLIVNESWPLLKHSITGKIETSKIYQALGINNPGKFYAPKELSKKFKLLRSIFPDKAEHAKVVGALFNFQAKVNSNLNDEDDRRGNKSILFEQAVESNVPESFEINIPLIEGEESQSIKIDIVIEAGSSLDIKCFLESADAAELVDESREKRVMEEVGKIEKHTTVIFI
jgi:hypothetical protein